MSSGTERKNGYGSLGVSQEHLVPCHLQHFPLAVGKRPGGPVDHKTAGEE